MNVRSHGEMTKYLGTYVRVFGALLVLTVVTVAASRLHIAVPLAIAVALAIAVLKGSLVAGFFMHLIGERSLIYAALILTGVLLAALLALPVLTSLGSIATLRTVWTPIGPR